MRPFFFSSHYYLAKVGKVVTYKKCCWKDLMGINERIDIRSESR